MPELPEVENVRLSLVSDLKNKHIIDCEVYLDKIIKLPDNINKFKNNILNLKFFDLTRKGKYLIGIMSNGYVLIVHLGMTGLLTKVDSIKNIDLKYLNHLHIKMILDDGTYLCYCDIRRFGSVRLLSFEEFTNFKPIRDLGPEPIDNLEIKDIFIKNLRKKKNEDKTIKELLMDQSVVAGIGNIYACESLYRACIDPRTLVSNLTDRDLKHLLNIASAILRHSISEGGSSVNDYMNGKGIVGNYQNYLEVYQKEDCPLGHKLNTVEIKGRNTFFCPKCQK